MTPQRLTVLAFAVATAFPAMAQSNAEALPEERFTGLLDLVEERLRADNARLRAQVSEYFREPATHPVEREE